MTRSSLVTRLRIRSGQRLLVLNPPDDYVDSLADLPEDVVVCTSPEGKYDFVHLFVRNSAEFAEFGSTALDAIEYDGVFWISYPSEDRRSRQVYHAIPCGL